MARPYPQSQRDSGKYDRIVVIGHSLGSMIAYDILKHLWSHYNTRHDSPRKINREVLIEYEKRFADDPKTWSSEKINDFHVIQHELWKEQQSLGNPWLISDFITLGSPLVYSSLLMASNSEELRERIAEREIPTCPPVTEEQKISYPVDYIFPQSRENPEKRSQTLMCLHHAAHFSCTRWANLYYQNDFVGGPLSTVLGVGIKDIKVRSESWLLNTMPFAPHTHYWAKANVDKSNLINPIEEIKKILDA